MGLESGDLSGVPVIRSLEEMKRYLAEGSHREPSDAIAGALLEFVLNQGADPAHLRIAYAGGATDAIGSLLEARDQYNKR
ncbi:MAG: hypothetical protein HYW26_00685 [Candidatus Aenigmarchaeota archaeon]|nr:hypothetical protein [Candidatus Aenigmarchaeota archaeon]